MGLFDSLGLPAMASMALECSMFSLIGSVLNAVLIAPKSAPWNVPTMIVMMSYSAFCFAPTAFYWYPFLESLYPEKDALSVTYKLLMDQLMYTPLLMAWFWFHSTYFGTFDIGTSVKAVRTNTFRLLSIQIIDSDSNLSLFQHEITVNDSNPISV